MGKLEGASESRKSNSRNWWSKAVLILVAPIIGATVGVGSLGRYESGVSISYLREKQRVIKSTCESCSQDDTRS